MDYTALLNEINTDPLGLGYAGFLPSSPGAVLDLLNKPNHIKAKTLMISERGIMAKYPAGPVAADAVLAKLETFSTTTHVFAPVVKRVLKFLSQPDGIDMGAPTTQTMIGSLGDAGAITIEEASALKALADQPASRSEVLGLPPVTELDLRIAGVY